MLETNAISKIYPGRSERVVALDSISLTVIAGDFVAVQGPSGGGKTTLLLTAGGLLFPDEGTVTIHDVDIYGLHFEDRALFRALHIGFVFQQFHLVPYLSVLDNVLVPSIAVDSPDADSRARELLDRFKMTSRLYHVPSELSTGERQRTALARALLNNPHLLLADEPTGNLDHENAEIVLSTFKEFAQTGGSVLMVTHDETISNYAHRTIRCENGRIVV